MQVILLQDVSNVGHKYEEVEVADGYGTNYLIPNGLAQVANDATRARYEKMQAAAAEARHKEREALAEAIEKLDGAALTMTVERAGDQGQLFAGIYPNDIAEAVNEEFEITITGSDIERDAPIDKVGDEEITVTILENSATFTLTVEAEAHVTASEIDEEDEEEGGEVDEPEAEE